MEFAFKCFKLMTPTNGFNTNCRSFYIRRVIVRKYIYISIGGALGAMLRFAIENMHIWNYNEKIPFNTLLINITGVFILALFLTLAYEIMEVDADLRLGVSTGFLGSFTTFSMVCKEMVSLMAGGEYLLATTYVTISIILGLAAAYLAVILARKTIIKLVRGTR